MMDRKNNFTLAFDSQITEDMLKTFMSCQRCKTVSTKTKLLKCTHTICVKCVMAVRKKQQNPGEYAVKCVVCNSVTFCYGDSLEGLQNINTVQKLVDKAAKSSQGFLNTKSGYYPSRGDDVSVNIVSAKREKQEIQRVWEAAQGKMQMCQEQAKQVKVYERKVQHAKMKIKTQIKESVDAYISSIRTQQDQLLEELDKLFQEDFHPVKEANNCIAMQMQSFRLVTECCTVAGKILRGGGAPMDMDNFKMMVKQSMAKLNSGKLPSAIKKTYKTKIYYKSNEHEYDEMAERLGQLESRKEKKSEKKVSPVYDHQSKPSSKRKEVKEEPIYDLPPEWETLKRALREESNTSQFYYNDKECIYDEIPANQNQSSEDEEEESSCDDECIPPPVEKDHPRSESNSSQVQTQFEAARNDEEVSAINARRAAMHGSESDYNDYDSFSDNSDDE